MGGSSRNEQEKLESLSKKISVAYPDLRVSQEREKTVITGSLPIIEYGVPLERYTIRIEEQQSGYPTKPPRVFELSGKIPKIRNRHFTPGTSPDTSEACVCLRDEWGWIIDDYRTLFDFIRGPIRDFFVWQACYDFYGSDKLGGYAHGYLGRLAFYQKKFQITDVEAVKKGLYHLSQGRYKPNWPCYCGSGKRVSNCHKGLVLLLRAKILPKVAKSALVEIDGKIQ